MPKKILLVEDEKILGEMYEIRLRKEGFNVKRVIDAESGLKEIKKARPDLILLDILLPGMPGDKALKILKEDPKTKDIPVIILTNYDTPESREKAKKLNTTYILKANMTTKDLVEIIEKEIKRI
jgi:CheY-like chemotaxis protein